MSEKEYEEAKYAFRAHAGYVESKERLFRFMEEAGVIHKEEVLDRLIEEGKILYDPKIELDWKYTLKFIAIHALGEVDEEITEEEKPTELPEGVITVKFGMKTEKDAESVETIFEAIVTGKYEFRSAVNIDDMVRTVMYDKGGKVGTPIVMFTKDKDIAWSLQQTIDWALHGMIKVVAVRRERDVVEVAHLKLGLKEPPPKAKYIKHFKGRGWKTEEK